MEKLSRVKKYEALRKSIENENENADAVAVKEAAKSLSSMESVAFKKIDVHPGRQKNKDLFEEQETSDEFVNEYMDDFIKEIREYNIRKGIREHEDTQIDILSQLNPHVKRTEYIDDIDDSASSVIEEAAQNTIFMNKDDIAAQIQSIIAEEVNNKTEDKQENIKIETDDNEKIEKQEEIKIHKPLLEIKDTLVKETKNISKEINSEKEIKKEKILKDAKKVIQMINSEKSQELDDEAQSNKVLNIVLIGLIVALIVVIGFIIYMIYQANTGGAI